MVYLRVLRPHQWLKNLLFLVPLITSQININFPIIKFFIIGFIGFSLICSANYIVNDLMDFQSDRVNDYKSQKPIAAGDLKRNYAKILASLLTLSGFALSLLVSINFFLICLFYLFLGLMYSIFLKHLPHVDIVVLVIFYLIRIFAGGILFSIPISFWLILFSFTIFSTLAFVKKTSKYIINTSTAASNKKILLTYSEIDYFINFGISFAVISLVTFALYLNSEDIKLLYSQPRILWLLIPLLQYLFFRIWKVTISGKMHYDPVIFLLRDISSFLCICTMLVAVIIVGRLN